MMHTVSRFEGECALILLDFFFKKKTKIISQYIIFQQSQIKYQTSSVIR